jgi:RimJ/RimL family protein N-acetyltransferase
MLFVAPHRARHQRGVDTRRADMFARTPRLTLRPAWPEDAPALAKAIAHESVVTKLSTVPWPYGEADALSFIDGRGQDDMFCLIVAHEGNAPALVGGIGLHPAANVSGTSHELGYWLTPAAWGRGYATEAGRAVIAMARHALGLKRIGSSHYLDNPASGRVLRKLGFRPTGATAALDCRSRGVAVEAALFDLDLEDRPTLLAA